MKKIKKGTGIVLLAARDLEQGYKVHLKQYLISCLDFQVWMLQ